MLYWCRGNPSASPKVRESIGPGRLLPQLGQGISEHKRHINPLPWGKHTLYTKKKVHKPRKSTTEKSVFIKYVLNTNASWEFT